MIYSHLSVYIYVMPAEKTGLWIQYIFLNSHSQSAIIKMQQINYIYIQNKILIVHKMYKMIIIAKRTMETTVFLKLESRKTKHYYTFVGVNGFSFINQSLKCRYRTLFICA